MLGGYSAKALAVFPTAKKGETSTQRGGAIVAFQIQGRNRRDDKTGCGNTYVRGRITGQDRKAAIPAHEP